MAEDRWRLGEETTGILFMLGAGLMFIFIDVGMKTLAAGYAILQVAWARYAFQVILVPLIVGRRGRARGLRSRRPGLQVGRSLFLLGATLATILALRYIPLAETNAISKVGPLFVTALSIPLLAERVGPRRWIAVVVGFAGALIIIRPGAATTHWAMFLPLVAALCFAFYQITTRKLAAIDPPETTLLYTALAGALLLSAVVPFVWRWPDAAGWAVMAGIGAAGAGGHLLLILAFRRAEASTLAPMSYVTLIWATLLGLVFFGDFPDLWTIVGALVIAASGVYVFYREAALARRPARPI